MREFFRASSADTFAPLVASVASLPELPPRRRARDVWFRLALLSPCVHPQFAVPIEHVPLVPIDERPAELGIDGRPRESRIASAETILCRRNAEIMLMLEHYPSLADTYKGEELRANLQRALERYLAAVNGEHVADSPVKELLKPMYGIELGIEVGTWPLTCVFAGDDVVIEWSDGEWTRVAASGTTKEMPITRPRFIEAQEASLLQSPDGRMHPLPQVAGYPVIVAPSPDGTLLWVADKEGSGGVFDVGTGLLAASARRAIDPQRVLARDGTVTALRDDWEIEDALTATYEEGQVFRKRYDYTDVGALGVVGQDPVTISFFDGTTPRGTLIGFPTFAQAFDESAERLALVDDREVLIVRLADDSIEHRYPLGRDVVPKEQ